MSRPEHRESMPWVASTGAFVTFRCGACELPRGTNGRKMMSVRGLRQWVCAHCAARREARPAQA